MRNLRSLPERGLQLVFALALGWASMAHAEEGPRDETERWVPSFSLRSGVTASNMKASVDSFVVPLAGPSFGLELPTIRVYELQTIVGGSPVFQSIDQPVFKSTQGNQTVMFPWFGGSIELMTPGLQSLPTRPRFFVHGDVQYNFAVDRSIARIDNPTGPPPTGLYPGYLLTYDAVTSAALGVDDLPGIRPPTLPPPPFEVQSPLLFPVDSAVAFAPASLIKGQGSKVEISEEPWMYQAGAGVAFTFELYERRLRFKPSVEYQRRKITISSVANAALPSAQPGAFVQGAPDIQPVFNIVQLSAQEELVIDGLGPGIELEMDTWQAGPFMLSIFIQGQFYRVLGETEVNVRGLGAGSPCSPSDGSNAALLCQRTFDFPSVQPLPVEPNPITSSGVGANDIYGDFKYEIEPWNYQAGVGLRFRAVPDRWIPERMPSFEMPSWMPW